MVFVYKKLAQFAVRCALPPRRSESPVCATDNKPSCALHLLGWFTGSRGFSSLELRPEFWVLQYSVKWDWGHRLSGYRYVAKLLSIKYNNLQPHKYRSAYFTAFLSTLNIIRKNSPTSGQDRVTKDWIYLPTKNNWKHLNLPRHSFYWLLFLAYGPYLSFFACLIYFRLPWWLR